MKIIFIIIIGIRIEIDNVQTITTRVIQTFRLLDVYQKVII